MNWINTLINSTLFRVTFLACSFLAMLFIGVIKLHNPVAMEKYGRMDTRIFYEWGQAWRQGLNAYDPELHLYSKHLNKKIGPTAYPPHASLLFMFLASFPINVAMIIMTTLNVFCVGVIAFFSLLLLKQAKVKLDAAMWFIPALVMGNPFVSGTIFIGQTLLIIGAALISGWYFAYRGRWVLGGILIAIASIKPQLTILVVFWLFLDKQWRLLTVAGITVLVGSIVPMVIVGPIDAFLQWLLSAIRYIEHPGVDHLGSTGVTGFQNVFYLLGVKGIPSFLPIGIVLTAVLWWYRAKFASINDIFGVLVGITCLFSLAVELYQSVIIIPLIAIFWIHLHQSEWTKISIAIILMSSLYIPKVLLQHIFDPSALFMVTYPVLILSILVIWLVWLNVTSKVANDSINAVKLT
jgi:hypothetical protein